MAVSVKLPHRDQRVKVDFELQIQNLHLKLLIITYYYFTYITYI